MDKGRCKHFKQLTILKLSSVFASNYGTHNIHNNNLEAG